MDFNHIGYHLPAGQTVINAIRTLTFPVAHVCTEISGSKTSRLRNSFSDLFDKYIQMNTARMTVAVSALNDNLGFCQIFRLPACSYTQRVQLRRQLPHFLTFQIFHMFYPVLSVFFCLL